MFEIGGEITHTTSNPGKLVIGTPSKGGEFQVTFDPGLSYESQKARVVNAVRIFMYTKYLIDNPAALPPLTEDEVKNV